MEPSAVRWQTLVVVCRQCSKRSSGPPKLKSKQLARTLRETMQTGTRRCRVVLSSCMGLCPKRAIAVACTGGAASGGIWSVGSRDEGGQLATQWLLATATAAPLEPICNPVP